jgi:V8-like Glu-specific endopeptidase
MAADRRQATVLGSRHFLDRLPLDWSDRGLQELCSTLAMTFWDPREVVRIAQEAGVDPASVNWSQPAVHVWPDLLDRASQTGCQRELVAVAVQRAPALAERVGELLAATPAVDSFGAPPVADGTDWRGFSPDGGEERIIVENAPSLLPIAFLQRGLEVARSVCRLRVVCGDRVGLGSGFRIGPDVLLTNHHVLRDPQQPGAALRGVQARFNHELDWSRNEVDPVTVECDPASVVGDAADDWAVIRTREPIPAQFPALDVADLGTVAVDDRVYIIQHPDGGPKMIGMQHNLVRHVDDRVLQYWTDTKNGSSGSPVFDERWRLVGLHHRWVSIDRGGRVEYRNQGRRIDRVLSRVRAVGVGSDHA